MVSALANRFSAAAGTPPPVPGAPGILSQAVLIRRLTYIMLVRVILYTLILGGTVAVHFAWGTPEELGGPHVSFLFVIIAVMYVLSILYSLALRYFSRLHALAIAQIAIDLLISTVLVHFTGSAESAFVLFFLLSPIAAAVTLHRRAAVITALVGSLLLASVVMFGHAGWLPVLPGQGQLPWEVPMGTIGRSLLINSAAMFAVAMLSGYLSEQLRFAAATMEVQQGFIDDLAVLNADIIRCLTSGLITINDQGIVVSLNRSAEEILGLSSSQTVGRPLFDIAADLARAIAQSDELRRAEVNFQRGDTPILLGVSVSQLTDHRNQPRGKIINFQDLTALRRMEETVKRSEHLASLGRMAAGIAHEIRNPLASISGSMELLRQADGLNAEDKQLMEIALREIERLDGLITDFLDFARPKHPRLEALDLGQEIQLLVGSISGLLSGEKVPEIRVIQAPEGSWIKADRDQLSGVLWNLVRNAWEAGEQQLIEITVGQQPDHILLQVTDHAQGIPLSEQGHIFEPFFTTKDKGTGLGLATVYRVIQEHGGSIHAQSLPGQGTSIFIQLPRIDSE